MNQIIFNRYTTEESSAQDQANPNSSNVIPGKGKFDLSAEDNELFVNEMLNGNEVIEDALVNWKKNPDDPYAKAFVYKALLERDNNCGGLIISVKSEDIPAGADNVRYCDGSEQIILNKVKGSYEDHYLLVFTSMERFKECNETAGVVMFIV